MCKVYSVQVKQAPVSHVGLCVKKKCGTHTTHVQHVGLSTSINDILSNYVHVCVFGPQMIVLRIELYLVNATKVMYIC